MSGGENENMITIDVIVIAVTQEKRTTEILETTEALAKTRGNQEISGTIVIEKGRETGTEINSEIEIGEGTMEKETLEIGQGGLGPLHVEGQGHPEDQGPLEGQGHQSERIFVQRSHQQKRMLNPVC